MRTGSLAPDDAVMYNTCAWILKSCVFFFPRGLTFGHKVFFQIAFGAGSNTKIWRRGSLRIAVSGERWPHSVSFQCVRFCWDRWMRDNVFLSGRRNRSRSDQTGKSFLRPLKFLDFFIKNDVNMQRWNTLDAQESRELGQTQD